MKRNPILTVMVLGALLTLAACSSDSPTSPPASPTPTAFSISLTASPNEAVVNSAIVVAARVTSGGQNVADGTSVTFLIKGCVPNSATTPHFENGTCEMVRTTQAGGATAVLSSQVDGAWEISARVPNAQASLVVNFYQPTDPQTLALYSITPTRGPSTGGQQVTIRGRGFAKPLLVEFVVNGDAFTAQIAGVNTAGTEIIAITPPVNPETATAEQIADVRVTAAAGTESPVTATMSGAYVFEKKFTDPRIYQIVPDRGLTTGGEPVTIYGANFVEPVKVMFGTENAQVTSVTAEGGQIHVLTPRHSGEATTVDVIVYTRFGTAQQQIVTRASAFTWVPPVIDPGAPFIYSIIPNRGSARGGEEVTILGANLCGQVIAASGECYSLPTVSFQIGSPVNATRAAEVIGGAPDGRSLRIRTPQATPEPLTQDAVAAVIVTNASGSYTAVGGFTYLHETTDPQLFSVQPNRGSPRGGEDVRLVGRNFTAPVKVEFIIGSPINVTYPAEVLSVSADGTEILIVTPQASPNPVTTDVDVAIRITTMVGSASSRTGTFNNAFTYVGESRPPIIYYLDPDKGSREGREQVIVYGRYFIRPVTVTFGNVGAAEVTDVATDGTTITILTPPARITLPADGKVDVTVVSEAGTGRDQQVTLVDGFQYLEAETPEIYSLAPNSGPVEGGTRVTINGRGFQYPAQVMFNVMGSDRQAQVVSINYSTIVCISPSITATQPSTPTIAQVRVVNATTGRESNSLPFRYGDAMFISAIAPSVGPDLGGQQVTIFGQGFIAPVAVTIAGVGAQPLTVSGTEIVALTGAPADRTCGNRSGPVIVTNINSNISATGPNYTYQPAKPFITSVDVLLNGASTGSNEVTYHDPQGITACQNSPEYSEYTVVVYGENFERRPNSTASAMTVIFENPPVEVLTTWISPTEISFQLPDLSKVQMDQAACTTGGVVGVRDIPTGLAFTVKNNNNNCDDRLNPAIIVLPCDNTCRVGAYQIAITPASITIGVGQTATFNVCTNPQLPNVENITLSFSGSQGVITPTNPTVTLGPGNTCDTFQVQGVSGGGPVTLTATLPLLYGGASAATEITVAALGVNLAPDTLNMPINQVATFTATLTSPAPQAFVAQLSVEGGGGIVQLENCTTSAIITSLNFAAGDIQQTFCVRSLNAGAVNIRITLASAVGGAQDVSTVAVGQYTVTLTPEDMLLAPGGTGNFTVTIDNPAPAAGLVVTLTQTGQAGIISIPASVTIPGNQQQQTFVVTAIAAGGPIVVTAQLPAVVGGSSDSSTVTVASYTVTLTPETMNLGVGQTGNFTVTLNRPASPANIVVTLTQTGAAGIINVPASVTVLLNQTTATFQITALAEGGPVTITASLPPSLNAPTDSSTVTVGPMAINASPTSLTIPVGGTGTFILNLSNPAPAPINVTTNSGNAGVATVAAPAVPHFATGSTTTAAFTVTGVALGTTTIYCQLPAAYGGGTAQVQVNVANYQLTAIPTSLTVAPGATGTFLLQLNQPAPTGGATITLASSNPQAATVPATVTILAGATQPAAPITVTGVNAGSSTITATLPASMGGSAASVAVTVANYTLTAVPSSLVVVPGGNATFVAQLNIPAPAGGLTVNAQSNNTLVATVTPATLAIAASGTVTGNFTVTGVTAGNTTITLSLPASVGGATTTVNVTVANYILSAVPASLTVPWDGWNAFVFQLNQAAPAGGLTVNLATSDNRIAYPTDNQPPDPQISNIGINGGSLTSPIVYVYGDNIGQATIYGQLTVGGSTTSVAVDVVDPLKFVPGSLTVPVGSVATFTLQMATALSADTTVELDYSGTFGAVAGPSTVTLLQNSTTVSFDVFGLKPTATPVSIVATLPDPMPYGLGGATATGTVTVTGAPYGLTITPNPVTLSIGGTVTMTLGFNYPLPPASFNVLTYPYVVPLALSAPGVTVLEINGDASTANDSVSFAAGQTSGTFTITGQTNGGPITITGTGPAQLGTPIGAALATVGPGTATLTMSPNPLMWQLGAPAPTITLSISPVQGSSTIVQLQSSNPSVVTVPATVVIGANAVSQTFPATVVNTGTATITATPPWETASPVRSAAAFMAAQDNVTIFDATVAPATLTIPAGGSGTLTINLTHPLPAALSGVTIAAPAYVSVPSPITIPAGVTSFDVTVTAVQPGTGSNITVTLPASAGGQALAPTPAVTVSALTFTLTTLSNTVYVGSSTTGTVTTSSPVPTDTVVTVTDPSGGGDLDVPTAGSVVIPAGGTTATFQVTGAALGTPRVLQAALPASLNATPQTVNMTIANLPLDLTPEGPVTLYKGTTQVMTATIGAARNAATLVNLTLNGASTGTATFPASVTIPAGSTSVNFTATPGVSGSAVIDANLPLSLSAAAAPHDTETLTITDLSLTLTPNPLTIAPNEAGTMTATIPVALSANAVVSLVNNGGLGEFTIPTSVTIPAGATSATFAVTASATTGTGTVEGSLPNALNATVTPHATATVNVAALPLVLSPDTVASLMAGGGQTFTLTIPVAQATPTDVQLTSSVPLDFSVPASVVIPAGQTSVTFTGVAESVGGPVTVTATLPAAMGGGSDSSVVTSIIPLTVAATPTVINNPAATDETVTVTVGTTLAKNVTLTLTSLDVQVAGLFDGAAPPAGSWSLVVPAGTNTEDFKIRGVGVGATQVQINAPTDLNPSALPEETIDVEIVALQLTLTQNISTSVGAWAPVTATLTNLSGGTVTIPVEIDFSVSANPANLDLDADTNPGGQGDTLTLTIPAGSNSVVFYVFGQANGSSQVTGQLDPIFGGGTALTTVGIAPGAPTVSSVQVAPNMTAAAPAGGGAFTVNIFGSNFVGLLGVAFGAVVEPSCTIFNAGLITCTAVPNNPAGTYAVTVVTAAGAGIYPTFRYYAPPLPTSVTPLYGSSLGGEPVTVNGTQFLPGGVYVVQLGGSVCTGAVATATTTITCTTPAHVAGTFGVQVTDELGQLGSAASVFTFFDAPTVSAIQNPTYANQAIGRAVGGQTVNIIGTNFRNTGTYSVQFDGLAPVAATYVNATTLSVTTPAYGTNGYVNVVVTDPAGQSASLAGSNDFAYYAVPSVTSRTPTAGPAGGGTFLTLSGTFFNGGTYTVSIGGSACTGVVATGTQITCSTGVHAAALAQTITVTDATAQVNNAFTFDYYAAPVATGISPSGGSTAGGTAVTITGTFLQNGVYTVDIGGSACSPVNSATAGQLSCTTSAHAAVLDAAVTVTDVVGQFDSSRVFDYLGSMTATSIQNSLYSNQAIGRAVGSETVNINGTNFLVGATYQIAFGGNPAIPVVAASTTQLQVAAPNNGGTGASGSVAVTVTDSLSNTVQVGGTAAADFSFYAQPSVTAVQNSLYGWTAVGAAAGGELTVIQWAGGDFLLGGSYSVQFGANAPVAATVVGLTLIQFNTPANGSSAWVDVVVTDAVGQTASLAGSNDFAYYAVPTVTSVAPGSGSAAGGTGASVTGTNFLPSAGLYTVVVDPMGATPATCTGPAVSSPTVITCTTGAHAAGGPFPIRVTDPLGQSGTSGNIYTYTTALTLGVTAGSADISLSDGLNTCSATLGGGATCGPFTRSTASRTMTVTTTAAAFNWGGACSAACIANTTPCTLPLSTDPMTCSVATNP